MPTVIGFEDLSATVIPPFVARPGALIERKDIKRGVPPIDVLTSRFDIVANIGEQAKPPEFGQRSLDPYFDQQDATPFTFDLGIGERGYLANTISITMGDYGEDADNLSIQLFDDEWRLIGSNIGALAEGGTSFTSTSLTADSIEGKRIRYVRFIGGSAEFPNSVFYDNITIVYTPTAEDLNRNPYWGKNVGQAVAEQLLEDAFNGRGKHPLDEIAVSRIPNDSTTNLAKVDEILSNIGALVEQLKNFSRIAKIASPAIKIAIAAVQLTDTALELSKQTGESPFDKEILKAAGTRAVGNLVAPGLGDLVYDNYIEPQFAQPQVQRTRSFISQDPFQNQEFQVSQLPVAAHTATQNIGRRIQGSSKNNVLVGTLESDYLFGRDGNDTLRGQQGADVLIGGQGNDNLVGKDGADVLNGNGGRKFFVGEVDQLTGGEGVDIFVLGDPNRVYYSDRNRRTAGTKDYASIKDFSFSQDFIVLKGKIRDYIFRRDKIFLNDDRVRGLSRNDELIAQVRGATNLSPIDIMFV